MKKTTAAIAASSIGVLAAGGAAAAPATAMPADDCTTVSQHTVTTGTLDADWYMDCVPQYGFGKAEFTIESTDLDFPEGLNLENATATSNVPETAGAYFGTTLEDGAFESLGMLDGASATSHGYRSYFVRLIDSVGSVPLTSIPTATCTGAFTHAYAINFAATTTTFTQVVDGVTWTFPITYPAATQYAAFTPNTTTGAPSGAICMWTSGGAQYIPTSDDLWPGAALYLTHDNDGSTLLDFSTSARLNLGTYTGTHVAVAPDPDPEPEPEPGVAAPAPTTPYKLAATGVDVTAPVVAGGALALLGAGLLFARRRRAAR